MHKKSLPVRGGLWSVVYRPRGCLFLGVLFDGQFAAVVTAFGANVVIHDLCAAVAASGQLGFLQRIVRSSLGRSGLRESVFWMWHIVTFFYLLFQNHLFVTLTFHHSSSPFIIQHSTFNVIIHLSPFSSLRASHRGSGVLACCCSTCSSLIMRFSMSGSQPPSGCMCCIGRRTAAYS